jgi:signal transduction histidine kinase
MKNFIQRYKEYNSTLPLDKQIHNDVLQILGIMALITGTQNFAVALPYWYGIMFIVSGVCAFILLILNYYKNWYAISKPLTVIVMYLMTIVSWFSNCGLDGPALIFIGALIVFTVGFYPGKYIILIVINVSVLSALILTSYYFPESQLYTYYTKSQRVIDMLSSYTLMAISIILVLNVILKNYNRASMTVKNQKTELESLNKDLKSINKELLYINASKDKLFSIIAHDLRSPMGTLVSFSDVLAKNLKDYDTNSISESLAVINNLQKKTLDLLEDLLLWSKSQSGKLSMNQEITDIRELCYDVIEEKRDQAARKEIRVQNQIRNEIFLYSDRNMLKTVLRNLVSNAIKFTDRGGEINLKSETMGDFEKLMVQDTGTGIIEEVRLKLWDIKTQKTIAGTEGETGSGLGLILCKEFVEKHGGEIWVESEQGNGSRFYFTIPLYQGAY